MPAAYQHPAPQYPRLSAEEAASRAEDHGRKVHELRWLYLDSVGQEFGPLPADTMQEWLTMGRFPVGLDLRVRLPEWDQHLPLRKIYPDLSAAFRLPPAWPQVCQDGKSMGFGSPEVEELRTSIRESGRLSGPFHNCVSSSSSAVQSAPAAIPSVASSSVSFAPSAEAVSGAAGAKVSRPERNKIPTAEQARDPANMKLPDPLPAPLRESIIIDRDELPPLPKAQSVLERLLQPEKQEALRLACQMNGQTKDTGRLFLEKVARGTSHKVNGTNGTHGTNGTNGKVEADRLAQTNGNGTVVALLQE
ncbi:unnamed protein product [Symbiodinium natans]|uniref:GYF domain-containing protein n=1 Tax=Symbiodinium natans TaxID=878477 RepID=A0A812GP98_9DINO|nr:unnamed protein product [Symbiodinium natans]